MGNYTGEELKEALQAVVSLLHKCESAGKKFSPGTAQGTLMDNRSKALRISAALITEALAAQTAKGWSVEECPMV